MNDLSNLPNLEAAMLAEPQVECPVTHHFGPSLYIREIFIPADTFALGRVHKAETMNILLKGKMAMLFNGEVKLIEGPATFVTGHGRKLVLVIEDCTFQNVYATDETDLDVIEEMFIDKTNELIDHSEMNKLIEHVNEERA